uniref:Uncharacterized protein n=1 Tax=Metapenaeus joyneri majanivirus TaxID=2984280 RepID=A0A9C7F0J5_9VIRU|nr:MAG: hypothetical protein [Metapenaeus joyneri majanivirus]
MSVLQIKEADQEPNKDLKTAENVNKYNDMNPKNHDRNPIKHHRQVYPISKVNSLGGLIFKSKNDKQVYNWLVKKAEKYNQQYLLKNIAVTHTVVNKNKKKNIKFIPKRKEQEKAAKQRGGKVQEKELLDQFLQSINAEKQELIDSLNSDSSSSQILDIHIHYNIKRTGLWDQFLKSLYIRWDIIKNRLCTILCITLL